MLSLKVLYDLRVVDGGRYLEPVADDARVGEETSYFPVAVACDAVYREAVVRRPEARSLFKDRAPAEARLVDLENEPPEELIIMMDRKAVRRIVVPLMETLLPFPRYKLTVGHKIIPRIRRYYL